MGTFSKAVGSFGAYCCGSNELISFLINKARSFIYTTAMPPAVAAASSKAIAIIESEPQLREKLWENVRYVKGHLKLLGFDLMDSKTPIIPILVKETNLAVEFSNRLLSHGILMSAIRPPTVPHHTARLRLTVMATHTKEEIDYTLNALEKFGKELKIV